MHSLDTDLGKAAMWQRMAKTAHDRGSRPFDREVAAYRYEWARMYYRRSMPNCYPTPEDV